MKNVWILFGLLSVIGSPAMGDSHEDAAIAYIRAVDLKGNFSVSREKVDRTIEDNGLQLINLPIVKNSGPAEHLVKEFNANLAKAANEIVV